MRGCGKVYVACAKRIVGVVMVVVRRQGVAQLLRTVSRYMAWQEDIAIVVRYH